MRKRALRQWIARWFLSVLACVGLAFYGLEGWAGVEICEYDCQNELPLGEPAFWVGIGGLSLALPALVMIVVVALVARWKRHKGAKGTEPTA